MAVYTYKGCVEIPPVSFVDDILTVSKCGVETTETNCYINAKVESKKLTLGADKCKLLHVTGNKRKKNQCSNSKSPTLKIHNESIKETDKFKYLGDEINSLGDIDDTIASRITKAIGLRTQIRSMIKSISLGSYYFEIALVFREACYLSSLLLNAEAWYPITKRHVEALEAADARFSTNSKTIRDAYYAETGK